MAFHVIDQGNRDLYAHVSEKMHKVRYINFVEKPGNVRLYEKSPLGLDVDEHDNVTSTWFNVVDDALHIMASGRFTSWEYSTVTGTHPDFKDRWRNDIMVRPDLLPDDEAAKWVDYTRIFYHPTIRGAKYKKPQAELVYWHGVVNLIRELGLIGYTGIIRQSMVSKAAHLPIIIEKTSDPFLYNGETHFTMMATVSPKADEWINKKANIFNIDPNSLRVHRNLEGLPTGSPKFKPEFAHFLNQYVRIWIERGVDKSEEVCNIWDHYMGSHTKLSYQAQFEIERIIQEITKIGYQGQLPDVNQEMKETIVKH